MVKAESDRAFFAECQACGAKFVAKMRMNGDIRPIGVPLNCTCGEGDFRRLTI